MPSVDLEDREKEHLMIDVEALEEYIYDNYNVPGDNTTLAPHMLSAILEYATELHSADQLPFLERMLEGLDDPEAEIKQFDF